jgi:hypothetical protein
MFLGLLDPDPDPLVRVMSGYGSGSGSFYHQAKKIRKTLIPSALSLFDSLLLKNDVNVPSKSDKQKNFFKLVFCWHLEGQ